MKKVQQPISSISPKYPTYRDETLKTPKRWLEGKRIDDNAEGLWRVHDKLYDLTSFVERHPGGAEWLSLTKGVDITEQFETHHLTGKAEQLLVKFYVREASQPRNYNFTFDDNGFFRTLRRKAAVKIQDLDTRPVKISKMISDLMLGLVFASAVLAVKDENIFLALLSGLFLFWLFVISHNFFHQKDNWRMLCCNLSLLNYREWRVSHAMSHHLYTNTYYDLEISMFEPFLEWIPRPKTKLQKIMSPIISPIVWTVLIPFSGIERTVGYFTKREEFKMDHLIPLALPLAMFYLGDPDLSIVLKFWMIIICMCSFMVGVVGLNAGHHHPDVAHEGDQIDDSKDFGVFQLCAVIDRRDLKNSHFWTLVSFGQHTLHHLFPTLDHGLLPQLHDTFLETCKEFEIELREYEWWPLIVGQFKQLVRDKPKTMKEMKMRQ